MGIKRYHATKDASITNALERGLSTRATNSNMGASDILEVFSLQNQALLNESAKATARFTVTGVPSDGQKFTLIDTAGNSVQFEVETGASTVDGSVDADGDIIVGISGHSSNTSTVAARIAAAINAVTGYNQSADAGSTTNYTLNITAYRSDNVVILVQDTAGLAGNTTVTSNLSNVDKKSFTGGSTSTNSAETQRILIQFPIDTITTDRTNKKIPAVGKVSFYLRMFNAKHGQMLPRNVTLSARALSKKWEEGHGLDMDGYKDKGQPYTSGSTWITASQDTKWSNIGGDFHASPEYTQGFTDGVEDLEIDITTLVEQWADSTKTNYGLLVQVTSSQEPFYEDSKAGVHIQNITGSNKSYYTKKFHSRTSEFFFKRPVIEARWENQIKDDRGQTYFSSSMLPGYDNLNTLYLYNYVKGQLKNVPEVKTGRIYVMLFSGSSDNTSPSTSKITLAAAAVPPAAVQTSSPTVITGGWVDTGVYTASFALTAAATPLTTVYDVWMRAQSGLQYFTGSFTPNLVPTYDYNPNPRYIAKITNLKDSYSKNESSRFRVFNRLKNWSPNIYNVASSTVQNEIIESGSFKIFRVKDNKEIIRHSTGSSDKETFLSYDKKGNFFDLDMSLLAPGYMYGIELAYYTDNGWVVQKDKFKFRVDDRE